MKKDKPKVLLSTPCYRIVSPGRYRTNLIEVSDGTDRMGARRWRDLTDEERRVWLVRIVDQIGNALILRAKRRRAARGGAS